MVVCYIFLAKQAADTQGKERDDGAQPAPDNEFRALKLTSPGHEAPIRQDLDTDSVNILQVTNWYLMLHRSDRTSHQQRLSLSQRELP